MPNDMGKLSVSLSKDDEELLRKIAIKNCRSISHQIAFWIRHDKSLKEEK